MKKVIAIIGIAAIFGSINVKSLKASPNPMTFEKAGNEWTKSTKGTWVGKDNKTWYKLDKTARLWMSTDGKTWTEDKKGMWQDKQGHWIQIKDKKLVWSADGGKTWAQVPEWKWEGGNGEWYKFDTNWSLWDHMGK